MAINTQEEPVQIEIPPQELDPFDLDGSEDFFDSDLESDGKPPILSRERVYIKS